MTVVKNIKSSLPKTANAKEFMKFVEKHSQSADESLARTLMGNLTIMKFDGPCTMHKHVIEIMNIVARLSL